MSRVIDFEYFYNSIKEIRELLRKTYDELCEINEIYEVKEFLDEIETRARILIEHIEFISKENFKNDYKIFFLPEIK